MGFCFKTLGQMAWQTPPVFSKNYNPRNHPLASSKQDPVPLHGGDTMPKAAMCSTLIAMRWRKSCSFNRYLNLGDKMENYQKNLIGHALLVLIVGLFGWIYALAFSLIGGFEVMPSIFMGIPVFGTTEGWVRAGRHCQCAVDDCRSLFSAFAACTGAFGASSHCVCRLGQHDIYCPNAFCQSRPVCFQTMRWVPPICLE